MSIKQVIVARTDLNMRKGKMAAQVAHASIGALLGNYSICNSELSTELSKESVEWLRGNHKKVVVGVSTEQELRELLKKANDADLPRCLVTDSGLTEFHGVPTVTCLAIGPGEDSAIDAITGGLKLL